MAHRHFTKVVPLLKVAMDREPSQALQRPETPKEKITFILNRPLLEPSGLYQNPAATACHLSQEEKLLRHKKYRADWILKKLTSSVSLEEKETLI